MDPELRINYSKFWLSLISPASTNTSADRRKYAELVGNIGADLVCQGMCSTRSNCLSYFQYPVFEAAITGRAALQDSDSEAASSFQHASGMIDVMPQTEEEMEAIRNAVISREGLLLSVFDVLRRIPRRVLMVLKLNDLTRYASSPFLSYRGLRFSNSIGALITP